MRNYIRHGLLVIFFIALLLPMMQKNLPFLEDGGPLNGYFNIAPDTAFTWHGWFDGSYQEAKGRFFNDHLGFRPFFVRLYSQANYTLFNKVDYGGTTMGADKYLFYDNYIDAYCGRDFAGYDSLARQMTRLKALQDTFAGRGKLLLLAYAPCKAWYCADKIPYHKRYPRYAGNNYRTCLHIGDSLQVDQVDFIAWFLAMKDTSREMLFSRQGIHWTNYGSLLGGDSLIRYIESRSALRMPHPHWKKVVHSTLPRDPDSDMSAILNLFFPITTETFCYPEVYFDTTAALPKLIFIGDSYNINFIRTGLMQHISRDWQFWFGFKDLVNKETYNKVMYRPLAGYDWRREMLSADAIIIMNTSINDARLGGGFIDSAFAYFFPGR